MNKYPIIYILTTMTVVAVLYASAGGAEREKGIACITLNSNDHDKNMVIAIQPLGTFDIEFIKKVKFGINNMYKVKVVVLPEREMPKNAYYKPRNRYRAEKILDYLDNSIDSKFTKIVGLTNRDISTTKGRYHDWGIFGLGSLGGQACVISTFRLQKWKVSQTLFSDRLVKVVNHELGHTFGLAHCSNKRCLMEDAKGTIKTVDNEIGTFCVECRKKIKGLIK